MNGLDNKFLDGDVEDVIFLVVSISLWQVNGRGRTSTVYVEASRSESVFAE